MRTATIDAVLGPVAEAIGEFLIANEEAELLDIPLGDLTPMAEAVGGSVKGLLDVAHSLALSTADQDLKIEMPLACQKLEDAVDDLRTSSRALKSDPLNSTQRAKMIGAAKGILSGTSLVLECFDDYEVRKVVRACVDARQQVKAMKAVESVDELVRVIQPACQSLITLAQLTDKRVEELMDPWVKVSLTQAREVIKGSSTLMVSSTKAYVTNMDKPSRDSAKEARSLCVEKLLVSIDDVEKIVQIKQETPQEKILQVSQLAKDRIVVREALFDIHDAVVAQSPEALQAAFRIFDPAANSVLANAKTVAATIQNPTQKNEILATVQNLERLRKEVEAAAKYAIAHPNDVAAQKRLADLLKQTDEEFAKLDKLVSEALFQDMNSSLAYLGNPSSPDATLTKLIAAAQSGDVAGLAIHTKKFQDEANTLRSVSEQVASRTNDPEAARAIRQAQKFLDDLLPQVIAAAKTVALNPDDPAAKEHLSAVVAEWEAGVARLRLAMEGAQPNEEIVGIASKGVKTDLVKFQEACRKQDAAQLKESSQAITQKIQAANAAIQREIENSTDAEYTQKLQIKLSELQKVLPELQGKAKNAFINPKDEAAQKALQDTGNKLVANLDDIKMLMHEHNNPSDQEKWYEVERHLAEVAFREEEKKRHEEEIRKKNDAERAIIKKQEEERIRKEEEEAKKAAEEEAIFLREQEALLKAAQAAQKDNPIKAAALDLKHEANKWESKGNKMIEMSQSLADSMAMLSELAKLNTPESKKQLIEAARKIAEDSKVIQNEAKKVAENCSDKRLKGDLLTVADRINTIANQIKILSTVKAANPDDHDNDQMLIIAATNLMGSVKSTIDASQSAQIRSFKTTAVVVTAALRWKKKAGHGSDPKAEPKSLASLMTKPKGK